jgi:hypothetical protein
VTRYPKYAIVEATVVGHAKYGLLVETDSGQRGLVEDDHIDDSIPPPAEWPPVGSIVVGVVVGYHRDGRVRLVTKPNYLEYVRRSVAPERAHQEWARLLAADEQYLDSASAVCESPDGTATLAWALGTGGPSRAVALRMLLGAPSGFKLDVVNELIELVITNDQADGRLAEACILAIPAKLLRPVLSGCVDERLNSGGLSVPHFPALVSLLTRAGADQALARVLEAMPQSSSQKSIASG